MSSSVSEGVAQMGKLVVHIAENGNSYKIECDEYTLVESAQSFLESECGIPFNDQLLLCLDLKLEPQRALSAYKLPSDEREVFLFNKARMRSNSPYPEPVQVDISDVPDPPLSSPSHNPHPLDDALDPALKALPSYERQFRYHYHCGHAIYSRTLARFKACERFLREQKVQEKALEVARGNLDHLYKMIHQNYLDFMKCYLQQHRSHTNLLSTFVRDKEKLRSIKILPPLQTDNRKCLLDFVNEENLHKASKDCSSSHKQFEAKVSEFKLEFEDLNKNVDYIFSDKASFLVKELESSIRDRQHIMNEQKNIMQALSKDVNTVKKLVDDCLSCQMSSSLRPHDAVSALGPMYDSHDKNYLPRMQACEREISSLLDFCRDKKNEMNIFVHSFMQKIAYTQYRIKDVRYKFSVFQEALKRQDNQFEQLKVVRGIVPAYRACLAEIVRRKATMKIYMGRAGQLAEKLATERNTEVRRREEFLRAHSAYIPRDILSSMGLYDIPNPCDVNVAPFDSNLLDIDLVDLECYAPESLLGLSSKSEEHGTLKGSLSMSDEGYPTAEAEGVIDFPEKYGYHEILEKSELVEIAGTSKMEVENAKLKAELASKIALICSMSAELDYESLDESKRDSLLKNAAEKTSEALRMKDEYEKHLQSMLKVKEMQCESYEKRVQELELRLSTQSMQGCKLSVCGDEPNFSGSTTKTDNIKSEELGVGEVHMHRTTEELSCASCTSKSGLLTEQDNMTDSSSMVNSQLDSSMLDLHRDRGHLCDKEKMAMLLPDVGVCITSSNMAVSMSQPSDSLPCQTAIPGLDTKVNELVLELQNALVEKSSQLNDAETKIQALTDEVSRLGRDLDLNRKLLDTSQMNCALLENCLHEAIEEGQTHHCAVDCRASEYDALRASAIKMCSFLERLKSCVSSVEVATLADSLHALAQSLAGSSREGDDNHSSAEFRECIQTLADKVGLLSRQRAEFFECCSKVEAANTQLNKELEEKNELVNSLCMKLLLEKQATKDKICFGRLEVHELAAFVLNSSGHYEAINCTYYYLSAESVALFADNLSSRPSYIVGRIVHIEQRTASDHAEAHKLTSESGTKQSYVDEGSTSNPYGVPVGCEYFVVTVAMIPDTRALS